MAPQLRTRDLELLEFVAEHRLILAAHAREYWGAPPEARLGSLARAGFLTRSRVFHRQPSCYQITGKGLAAVGATLPVPRLDLRCYDHDVGVAWLWLAAREGAFGPLREVLGERRLRSHDGSVAGRERPLAVRLGGVGAHGRERLHYPDLLLVDQNGNRIALELERSSKGRTRREQILAGYGADPRIAAVVYLVEDRRMALAVESSARRLGIADRVHVQRVAVSSAAACAAAREVTREPRAAGVAR